MDWILERTVHKGLAVATFGEEVFWDLDYADDVALLAEMLEVLILSLHVMQEEARPFGLEINWSKTIFGCLEWEPVNSFTCAFLLRVIFTNVPLQLLRTTNLIYSTPSELC